MPGGDKPTRPATRFHRPLEDLVATGEALSAWWCPPGCRIIDASAEFRPGGSYSIDVAPVGGGRPFRIEGRYVSIDRQRHLVFTHTFPGQGGHGLQAAYRDAESVVAVSLRPSGAGTAMRLEESALPSEAARELLAGGWPTLLDQLARHLRAGR